MRFRAVTADSQWSYSSGPASQGPSGAASRRSPPRPNWLGRSERRRECRRRGYTDQRGAQWKRYEASGAAILHARLPTERRRPIYRYFTIVEFLAHIFERLRQKITRTPNRSGCSNFPHSVDGPRLGCVRIQASSYHRYIWKSLKGLPPRAEVCTRTTEPRSAVIARECEAGRRVFVQGRQSDRYLRPLVARRQIGRPPPPGREPSGAGDVREPADTRGRPRAVCP